MKSVFKFYFSENYTTWEWFCIKIALMLLWYDIISEQIGRFESAPIPVGICKILPCHLLNSPWLSYVFFGFVILLSFLYLLEKKMLVATFMIFFISLLFFTLEESNGILARRGLLTFLFFAQFIAYSLSSIQGNDFNLTKYRIQFSAQVIAIGYFLSGLSKLRTSGISWIQDGTRMPLQILKSFNNSFNDYGDFAYLEQGNAMAHFIDSNPMLVYVILAITLLLELGAISILFFSRRYMVIYGLLLFLMHQGIYMVMNIKIVSIMEPMTILFINSFYFYSIVIYVLFQRYFLKAKKNEIVSFN